jgi:hypothetical protein
MGEPVYDVRPLSETGDLMRSSIGLSVVTEPTGCLHLVKRHRWTCA